MTTTQIIAVLAVIIVIAVALLAARSGGPRVTTIEHRVESDNPGEDE